MEATVRSWLGQALAIGQTETQSLMTASGEGEELSRQQQEALERGVDVAERYGGVILADAVGLGKTRVALQMARRLVSRARRRSGRVEPALFVVPARLRRDWGRAISEAGWQQGRDAVLVSHYQLSRSNWPGNPPVVVVDEAHKFRNPKAIRSRNLARITAKSQVILTTATPICTSKEDLHQLLRFFLTDDVVASMVGMGLSAAFAADEAGEFDVVEILEEVVIRRRRPDFGSGGRPGVRFEIVTYDADEEEAWLWRNLEPCLRELNFAATGNFWPRALLINNLMRMWESGPRALLESLGELLHFHERALEAARQGRSLERPDFQNLFGGVHRRQGVFEFLFHQGVDRSGGVDKERLEKISADMKSLQRLCERVEEVSRRGPGMLTAIVDLVEENAEESFLIFAAFQTSARAIFDAIVGRLPRARVGLVTGDGARATGLGAWSADDIVERFAGGGQQEYESHQQIRVLVATDCLSEGVNLQRCSRLILADLPYSPVRLEQRIGRIARPGSSASRVDVYLPRPRSWTDSLGMRRRLGERINMADSLGAGHDLAGIVSGKDACRESDSKPGPLAAMTLEERLWRQVRDEGPAPLFARQHGLGEDDEASALWVRVAVEGALRRYLWIAVMPGNSEPMVRLSEQLPHLARLADNQERIVEAEPGGSAWRVAQGWMTRRRQLFEAASLAPPLLGSGAEPVRIWRMLKEAAGEGEIKAEPRQLEAWRRKLLRPHPPGLIYEMEDLLAREATTTQRLLRFVDALPETPPEAPITLRAVAALEVRLRKANTATRRPPITSNTATRRLL